MGLSVSLPAPFETVPGKVKVYVLAREVGHELSVSAVWLTYHAMMVWSVVCDVNCGC